VFLQALQQLLGQLLLRRTLSEVAAQCPIPPQTHRVVVEVQLRYCCSFLQELMKEDAMEVCFHAYRKPCRC
jgi:hypothetical protein